MRKSSVFFLFIFIIVFVSAIVTIHVSMKKGESLRDFEKNIEIVKNFNLSDLCLFTEASYTRHLSQGDLFTAFQDGPLSLEHFPSGSIAPPPEFAVK